MKTNEVSFEALSQAQEKSLILKAQKGDRASFEELILRFQEEAYAMALKTLGDPDEARDIVQEAFLQAYQSIRKFRQKARFSTWLIGIVINLCHRQHRKWAQRRKYIVGSLNEPLEEKGELIDKIVDPSPTSMEEAVHREAMRKVMRALRTLDRPSRTAMFLRDVKGMSYDEIARTLGCRIGTVKSRLNRARLRVKGLLEGKI
ncbi:MAG: sigma-70 family RNA polymerase sigma factor [Chlamydiae bacterium]|nr:sigma-70 family RNA polymerase sigma factor [Chlamydiota bacterium]MBI3267001.1 sigma-70 family RNA polymerase sigma factor [Chlamydiota bacterium]